MKRKTFIFLMLSIFILSVNAQVQSFKFTSLGNKFKLDEQTEVEGSITISPEVSTASESGISSILPNISYNIEAGMEYTISGEFKILDCCANQLDSLNVTGLTSLVELWCHENDLKSLNVSGLANLSELWLSDNQITSIDVSGLAMLKTFDCNNNQLKSLDLTNLSNLEELICFGNPFSVCGMDSVFSSLHQRPENSSAKIVIGDINENSPVLATCRTDLANSKNWKVLRFANDYVTHQEITNSESYGCPESEEFVGFSFVSSSETFKIALVSVISGTDAISVDPMVKNADGEDVSVILKGKVYKIIPNTPYKVGGKFVKLNVNENNLTELSFSGLTNLSHLWCTTNQLKSIDVSGLTKMTNFSCYENQLKSLDLSYLTVIKSVFCNSNNFSVCGLDSLFTSLPARVQSDNATIVLARNEDPINEPLKTCRSYIAKDKQWLLLHFKGNMSNSVEIINSEPYGCPESTSEESFKFISSGTTFILGSMTETTSEIKISPAVATAETSDISTIQKQTDYIILPNTEYTVSGEFTKLQIGECQLISLDVSKLTSPQNFWCSTNTLKSLDVSSMKNLEYLSCYNNELESLELSNLPNLKIASCMGNKIKSLNLSGLPSLHSVYCENNLIKTLDVSGLESLKRLKCNGNDFSICGLDSLFLNLPQRLNQEVTGDVLIGSETLGETINTCRLYLAADRNWRVVDATTYSDVYSSGNYACDETATIEDFRFVSSIPNFRIIGEETEFMGSISLSSEGQETITIVPDNIYNVIQNKEYTVSGEFRKLNISDLGLTSLDISELSMLKRLDCSNNNLSSLDLSKNTSLLYVDSEKNNLSVLDISNLDDIVYLDCSTNNLIDIKMDNEIEEPGAFMGSEQSLNILMKKNSDGNYTSVNSYDVASNHQFVIDNAGSISFVDGYFKSTELSSDEKTFTTNIGWGEEMKLSGKLKFEYEQIVKYTITASVDGGNGSISPSDEVEVVSGESQEFKIIPNPEYGIESVFVDGNNVTSLLNGDIYKFENVQANHKITVKFVHSSSISEQLLEQINIYPNPIFHELQISSPEIIEEVYVYDISGKLLIKENVNNTQACIETSEIGRGMYVLRVQTTSGLKNFKIVKE